MTQKTLQEPKEMTFLDHLEDLRWTIMRSIIALLVCAVVAFIFKKFVFDVIILSPKDPDFITNRVLCFIAHRFHINGMCMSAVPVKLINITLGGQFITHINISLITGFIVAFPYIAWEFWRFIKPALFEKEKRYTRLTVLYISVLFFTGVLMGYFIITPVTIMFLASYVVSSEVTNTINLSSYLQVTTGIWFASGLVFELPVVTYFLARLGIVTSQFMKRYRKHMIIVILFLAAIITPTPDMFTQTVVALPLYLLYEGSIRVAVFVEKKKKEKEELEEKEEFAG